MTGWRHKLTLGILAVGLLIAGTGSFLAHPAKAAEPAGLPDERHAQLNAAIKELQNVRRYLEKADHDFGGHRSEVMAAVDEATKQLRTAKQYDKE